jgi:hypothetical protein
LDRKYRGAPKEWAWQYVFPARGLSNDPRSGKTRRHHLDEAAVHKAIKIAARRVGITKRVRPIAKNNFRLETRQIFPCTNWNFVI